MKRLLAHQRTIADRSRRLAETLAWLRLSAVVGQALTVLVVARGFDLAIPTHPLIGGIAFLAAFAAFAFWRLRRPWPLQAAEALGHVTVDVLGLTWLLYWSGGADNPFATLLVIPVALAAAALPVRHVIALALLAFNAYAFILRFHAPLPMLDRNWSGVNLHIAASTTNFAVITALLAFFTTRLAQRLRDREVRILLERERALRDEGILAIATQAAGTAHELNTPLSTIRTLLSELRRERAADAPLAADLELLAGQADRCRDILRELVAIGRRQLSGAPLQITLGGFVAKCSSQFRLLRPEVELHVQVDGELENLPIEVVASMRHAIINLLCNAADATLAAGEGHVELAVQAVEGHLEYAIRDYGSGAAPGEMNAFRSGKRDGLGLGLTLAQATAERLGGELLTTPAAGGGLLQRLRLPLATAENVAP